MTQSSDHTAFAEALGQLLTDGMARHSATAQVRIAEQLEAGGQLFLIGTLDPLEIGVHLRPAGRSAAEAVELFTVELGGSATWATH